MAADDDGATIAVVGGGPCAAMAARELVRGGHHVTMLDAGLRAPRGVTIRIASRTVARFVEPGFLTVNRPRFTAARPFEWTSSLSCGGLTNYWTGAVPRFAPHDFTDGARVDERFRWPIGYDDLAPFYELAEDDLQITSGAALANVPPGRARWRHDPTADWQRVIDAAAERGHHIAPMPISKGSPWMVAMRPREFTSYHSIVEPLLASPDFRLMRGAHVLQLNHSPKTGTVDSLDYVDTSTSTRRTLRARAFVVAAGTLDSTEILLHSTSDDFPNGLGNNRGVLGRYLHDHPKEWWPARLDRRMRALHHPLYVSRSEGDLDGHPLAAASLTIGLGRSTDRLYTMVPRSVGRVGVQVLGTVVPRDEVGASITGSRRGHDRSSLLRVDLSFDDAAVATLRRARQRFEEILGAAGIHAELGPFHELVPGTSYHVGGTARMHDDPAFGVVDGWNRVHDAPNVVVGDASCFTTGPEKNPTLTAMAIAARAARHLSGTLD